LKGPISPHHIGNRHSRHGGYESSVYLPMPNIAVRMRQPIQVQQLHVRPIAPARTADQTGAAAAGRHRTSNRSSQNTAWASTTLCGIAGMVRKVIVREVDFRPLEGRPVLFEPPGI
jgi:hypothetical protein